MGVSLLVNFEKNKKWNEWEVGKHGIVIEFDYNGDSFNGTFLPEVAKEQGWDVETTVKYLIRKAGCSSKKFDEIFNLIKLTTYESSKEEVTYEEFLKM